MTSKKRRNRLAIMGLMLFFAGYVTLQATSQNPSPIIVSDLDWSMDGQVAVGISRWDGLLLQACSTDLQIVDSNTQQTTYFPRRDDLCSPSTVNFDVTNSRMLISSANTLEIWNLFTGQSQKIFRMDTNFQSASYSPDESKILATILSNVIVMDADLETAYVVFQRPNGSTAEAFLYSVWSSNGLQVASSMSDGRIYIWNVVDSELLNTFAEHNSSVRRLAWNPLSDVIASGDDEGVIWLWDAVSGEPIRHLTGHTGIVYDLAWHPDGELLASAGEDGTVRIWDATSGASRIFDTSDFFSVVAYSPDGAKLAYGGLINEGNPPELEIVDAPVINEPPVEDAGAITSRLPVSNANSRQNRSGNTTPIHEATKTVLDPFTRIPDAVMLDSSLTSRLGWDVNSAAFIFAMCNRNRLLVGSTTGVL